MTTVELGSNRFVDCRSIFAHDGAAVLAVALDPLRVTLGVPGESGGVKPIIEDGRVVGADDMKITTLEGSSSFAVFAAEQLVLVALVRADNVIHLKLDLRPLNLLIYDDIDGLHIGDNVFNKNAFANAEVAIALG